MDTTVPVFRRARTVYHGIHSFDFNEETLLVHRKLYHIKVDRRQNIRSEFSSKHLARISLENN